MTCRYTPLTVAVALLVAGPASAGPNLLVNGSFDGGPAGWSRTPATWPACVEVAPESTGFAGLALDCPVPPVTVGWSQTVAITGGRQYHLAHRVMARALCGSADVTLTFLENGKVMWETGVQEVVGTQPWVSLVWEVLAPPGANAVRVTVGVVHGTTGMAGLDDVELEEATNTGPRELAVDLESDVGRIRHFGQSNRGPVLAVRGGTEDDFGERLRQAGITMLRQHDVHTAFDMHVIFPDPGADPALPSSYDFATTDEAIRQARAAGFEIMFRLGESYGEVKSPRMTPARWAEVVRHVVRHVNGDWAGGLRAGVRYWEIWNEANGPLFWSGTAEAFYELFAEVAKAVKAEDPTARVGGPGMAGHTDETWLVGLLRHCRAVGAPVDFVSWHVYHMGNPLNMARAQRQVRALVDTEGFAGAEVMNTEWNLNGGSSCERVGCASYVTGAYNAAHAAAALVYLQDTDIAMAFRYRTDGAGMFGLFGFSGEPAWARSGLAYALFAHLATTPVRLVATGGDEAGFAVLGGRSTDGRLAHVLVADQGSPAGSYRLRLDRAPARFTWWVEAISDAIPCTSAACSQTVVAAGNQDDLVAGAVEVPITAPAVHLVHVEAAGPVRVPRRHLGGVHH